MPELPEVETVRCSLAGALVGHRIVAVRILTRSVVTLPEGPPAGFSRTRKTQTPVSGPRAALLKGSTITAVLRHGKQLALVGGRGPVVCIHLGMTGSIPICSGPRPKHTHIEWLFDNGSIARFVDPRRFGLVVEHPSYESLIQERWSFLGPDALTLRMADLTRACLGHQRPVKSILLDQALIAGIGNIYADESLFRARIHPQRAAASLDRVELRVLATAIRTVLRRAVQAGGSTIRDYRKPDGKTGSFQHQHLVYGRAGCPCTVCRRPLNRSQVAGRTTVFCFACQPCSNAAEQ